MILPATHRIRISTRFPRVLSPGHAGRIRKPLGGRLDFEETVKRIPHFSGFGSDSSCRLVVLSSFVCTSDFGLRFFCRTPASRPCRELCRELFSKSVEIRPIRQSFRRSFRQGFRQRLRQRLGQSFRQRSPALGFCSGIGHRALNSCISGLPNFRYLWLASPLPVLGTF